MPDGSKNVKIELDSITLLGILTIPDNAKGLVVFVHGSGSSRFSPRNLKVAEFLNKENFATLLFDLLTETEDSIFENRFNIKLITERLIKTTDWINRQPEIKNLPIGYFGASTGAAAALDAAAFFKNKIKAVISRGGRPDLSFDIGEVMSPTLFIVGGDDKIVIKLNKEALEDLNTAKKLEIVPGAGHLFEEPGSMESVSALAANWFKRYLK